MGFSLAETGRVGRFWGASRMARHEGLKAVEMFEAIARGDIKSLWILGTNPAVSLPRADEMRTALTKLDLLVISDNTLDRYDRRWPPCALARRGLGRKRPDGDKFRAADLAPARLRAARKRG
jgi:hypothetical protein